MTISRNESIVLASFMKMLSLSDKEIENELENALAENGSDTVEDRNFILRSFIAQQFASYTNQYIQSFLSERLNINLNVEGQDASLFICPCCKYYTLPRKIEYFICGVCYWEDDGSAEDDVFSTVNKMSLREAKMNFKQFGIISRELLEAADSERMDKYRFSGRISK
jgi:hypothetical protein